MIKSILSSIFSSKKNVPTYDLNGLGVDVTDKDNFRAVPYIIDGGGSTGRKRRFIEAFRQRQSTNTDFVFKLCYLFLFLKQINGAYIYLVETRSLK